MRHRVRQRGGLWNLFVAACCLLTSAGAVEPAGCPDVDAGGCGQLAAVSTLFRRAKTWSDYAEPVAVLQLGQPATALHYVPATRAAAPPRFLAVGDAAGGLHLLSPATGRLVAQHHTGTASPVTAVGSYLLRRNTTVLLTGHASGELRVHSLLHPRPHKDGGGSGGGEADETEEGDGASPPALSLALLQVLPPSEVLCGTPLPAAAGCEGVQPGQEQQQQQQAPGTCAAAAAAAACSPITAVHGQGRGGQVASTAVVYDAAGRLAVLKHGGLALHLARLVRQVALEQPAVAARVSSVTATLLGSSGVANQRLAISPPPPPGAGQQQKRRAGGEAAPPGLHPCTGLNGTRLVSAAFDQQHASRAYALAGDGRMLTLVVGGDKASQPTCRVRAAALLPAGLLLPPAAGSGGEAQVQQPGLALAAISGYLLASSGGQAGSLLVFNVTLAPRKAPSLLLRQPLAALRAQFGVVPPSPLAADAAAGGAAAAGVAQAGLQAAAPPLLAASKQGQVALLLNASVLALYETALPYRAPPQSPMASMAWLQLFQPMAMLLVGGLVIYRARARRGGGGGGAGAGGGLGLSGDARLREFERLLQDGSMAWQPWQPWQPWQTMAGVSRSRHQPGPALHRDYDDDSGSGSDGEGSSLMGRLRSKVGAGRPPPSKRGGLLGRNGGGGGGGEAGGKERSSARMRAFALAASDDRETAAARVASSPQAAGGPLHGSSSMKEEEEEDALEQLRGRHGLAGAFGSDIDMRSSVDDRDVAQLRHRLGQTRIA